MNTGSGPADATTTGTVPTTPEATGAATTVVLLTLGSHLQADSFETFARTHYLLAFRAGAGLSGGARAVRLIRRRRESGNDPLDLDRQFLLLVEGTPPLGDAPRVTDPTIQRRFDAYAPQLVRLGAFIELDPDTDPTTTGDRP